VPKHDPLHKVTIIPRGRALGLTMSLPERDRHSYSKLELESKLAVLFGGRIAEELVFGADNVTTGAGNDIRQATEMARRMVTEFGFSDRLGPLRYTDNQEEIFLGHSVTQQKHVSDATARLIDEEVRSLIDQAEESARCILNEHRGDLDLLAGTLLEYETVSGEEVKALLRGEAMVRPNSRDEHTDGGRRASVPASRTKPGKEDPRGRLEAEPQPNS
jgi:cell division protease FtsH